MINQEHKLNELVKRALRTLLGVCKDAMWDDWVFPIITPGAQETMELLDRKLREGLGEAASGVARCIMGTLLLKPTFIVGTCPQRKAGQHDFFVEIPIDRAMHQRNVNGCNGHGPGRARAPIRGKGKVKPRGKAQCQGSARGTNSLQLWMQRWDSEALSRKRIVASAPRALTVL